MAAARPAGLVRMCPQKALALPMRGGSDEACTRLGRCFRTRGILPVELGRENGVVPSSGRREFCPEPAGERPEGGGWQLVGR